MTWLLALAVALWRASGPLYGSASSARDVQRICDLFDVPYRMVANKTCGALRLHGCSACGSPCALPAGHNGLHLSCPATPI